MLFRREITNVYSNILNYTKIGIAFGVAAVLVVGAIAQIGGSMIGQTAESEERNTADTQTIPMQPPFRYSDLTTDNESEPTEP